MTSRWKFGQVEFRINPSSVSNAVSQVGDNVRTLSGTVISQPTGYVETYGMTAKVYQPNARVLREISMPNALFIKHYNEKFYVLNATGSKIVILDNNLYQIGEIIINASAYLGYVGFDVYNDKFYIISKVSSLEEIVYELDMGGNVIKGITNSTLTGQAIGFSFASDNLWRANDGSKIQKLDYNSGTFQEITHIHTPMIMDSYYGLGLDTDGYYGLTSIEDRYLAVAVNRGDIRAITHMDALTGNIASSFFIDGANFIDDIEQVGDRIFLLNREKQSLQVVRSNTTLLDLHKFEREIQDYGYVHMEDDIGSQFMVSVVDYSRERVMGYEHMYNISMRVQLTMGGAL